MCACSGVHAQRSARVVRRSCGRGVCPVVDFEGKNGRLDGAEAADDVMKAGGFVLPSIHIKGLELRVWGCRSWVGVLV